MSAVTVTATRQRLWDGGMAVHLHIRSGPGAFSMLLDVVDALDLADSLYGAALPESAFEGDPPAST